MRGDEVLATTTEPDGERVGGGAVVRPIAAYVFRIEPGATFTPENTYFRDDRVKQVVGVKLQLKGRHRIRQPRMPADGEGLVEADSWPAQRSSK